MLLLNCCFLPQGAMAPSGPLEYFCLGHLILYLVLLRIDTGSRLFFSVNLSVPKKIRSTTCSIGAGNYRAHYIWHHKTIVLLILWFLSSAHLYILQCNGQWQFLSEKKFLSHWLQTNELFQGPKVTPFRSSLILSNSDQHQKKIPTLRVFTSQ